MANEDDPIPPGRGRVRIEAIDALGQVTGAWTGLYTPDGKTVGGTYGGKYLEDVAPGTYRAEIHHPQHDTFEIHVGAGAVTSVRSRARGRIRVEAVDAVGQPAGVWRGVVLDSGDSVGTYSGDAIVDVLPGSYRAEIHHPQRDTFQVTVAAGAIETRRSRARGRVIVRAVRALGEEGGPWHGVLDETGTSLGGEYGQTAVVDVLPGTYVARINHPQVDEFSVTVAAGATEERRSRPRGRIIVDAVGALGDETGVWQGVQELDGTSLGGSYGEPAAIDVLPGSYRAVIHHPQHDELDVTIAAGSVEKRRSRPRGRIVVRAVDALGGEAGCWHGVLTTDGISLGGAYGGPASVDVLPGAYHAEIHHLQHDTIEVSVDAERQVDVQSRPRGRIDATVTAQPPPPLAVKTIDGEHLDSSYQGRIVSDVLPGSYDVIAAFDPPVKRRVEVAAHAVHHEALEPSRVARIELEMPGHELDGDTYRVCADPPKDDPDRRPCATFRIKVFDGAGAPSSDGTRVRLVVRSEGNVRSESSVFVRGQACSGEATTSGGVIEGTLRCGPSVIGGVELPAAPAMRWRLSGEDIEYLDAAMFVLEATAGDVAPSTIRMEIVPGRPAQVELLLPSALPPGMLPDGIAEVGGTVLEVGEVRYDYKVLGALVPMVRTYPRPIAFRLGGWARAAVTGPNETPSELEMVKADGSEFEPLPGGIHNVLGAVTDAAGNACPIAGADDVGTRVRVGFSRWKSVGEVSHPFVLADPMNRAIDAHGNVWRCKAQHPLPDNVFFIQFVPAFGLTTAQTDLCFSIADTGQWNYRFTDRPASAIDRALFWFASGDPQDGWQYVGELVIGFIPLFGDSRDLLIYGMKHINGEKMGVLDHCMAVLSLIGLVLDIAPLNPAERAAASAKHAIQQLKRIPSGPAEALAKAITEQLVKGLPKVDNAADWEKLVKDVDYKALSEAMKELEKLGDAIKALNNIKKARKLLTVLGLAVVVVQLRTLLALVASYGFEIVVDLLDGLEELEKP